MNPTVTFAFAAIQRFPWKQMTRIKINTVKTSHVKIKMVKASWMTRLSGMQKKPNKVLIREQEKRIQEVSIQVSILKMLTDLDGHRLKFGSKGTKGFSMKNLLKLKHLNRILQELPEKPTIVVSAHGKLCIDGLRVIIDEGYGLKDKLVAATVLPPMKIVRDTNNMKR